MQQLPWRLRSLKGAAADNPGGASTRLNFHLYFTPTRRDSGALRVLSGSHTPEAQRRLRRLQLAHRRGLHSTAQSWADATFGVPGADLPCHAIETDPGDLVLVNQASYHGVVQHARDRMMLQLSFSAWPTSEPDLAALNRDFPLTFEPHENLLRHSSSAVRGLVEGLPALKGAAARARLRGPDEGLFSEEAIAAAAAELPPS